MNGSHLNLFIRYLLRVPTQWDATTSPRPIVFLHGLGLGLIQYHVFLSQLLETFTDRPILIPLQPQISQDIFHPLFLKPLDRHEMANQLASLIEELGWATSISNDKIAKEIDCEEEAKPHRTENFNRGITILSHSKYVLSTDHSSFSHSLTPAAHIRMPGC